MSTPYTVCIAGSTERSRICASAIFADERFKLTGIITPTPKPVGRKQIVEPNALHTFSVTHEIPLLIVEKKLDSEFEERLKRVVPQPDILLVVDFGYIIKQSLLDWPKVAPVNVHPSDLPKYRGSSPGQFAIALGEKKSAVSIMVMDHAMDHGPLIAKIPFSIDPDWLAEEYYHQAFSLVREKLSEILFTFIQSKQSTPQPDESPTPIARMLKREDGYIPFGTLASLLSNPLPEIHLPIEPIPFLTSYQLSASSYQLYCLWRGLHPWPGLWTTLPIHGQDRRMKLLKFHLEGDSLVLDEVQVEGKTAEKFTRELVA